MPGLLAVSWRSCIREPRSQHSCQYRHPVHHMVSWCQGPPKETKKSWALQQGSWENDGISDVSEHLEFKIVSNCCYPNCSRTNCRHFGNLGNIPEFYWIYLSLPEFSWTYLNLPKFTWIHLNFPEITWNYLKVPWSTCNYLDLHELPESPWIYLNLS